MRIRQHVNPLTTWFFKIPQELLCSDPKANIEVELGSADAKFLMERGASEPEITFYGLEIRREMVRRANEEAAERGLNNVKSVFANISVDLRTLFSRGQVRRFFLYFPDPWFKEKHKKRRVMSPALLDDIHWALHPEGELHVSTDVFDVAIDAMSSIEGRGGAEFTSLVEPWSFIREPLFESRSRREDQCKLDGHRVWRMVYRKTD